MTDRELLELAAKAAGRKTVIEKYGVWYADGYPFNPLTDDGDALRLAVTVGAWPVRGRLTDDKWQHGSFIRVVADVGGTLIRFDEPFTDDPYAATRRVIVRAAAEIGKGRK